ncbi:Ribonuclease h domain [Thalictrum thalictroides]|uniref:Ribonuclease h domain n=1 Tax=Thalictrum thalictroides TaxID=46969 RepID=A0A7J6WKX8_THATH|nr:Ribonuclease h domain [Thalictrum thalictroides]
MASRCSCCTDLGIESIQHLFIQGDLAAVVWKHFMMITRQSWPRFRTTSSVLNLWFSMGKVGSLERFIYTLIPVSILWELWRERCRRRFEDNYTVKISQGEHIIFRVRYWALRLSKFFIPSTRSSDSFSQVAMSLGILHNDPPVKPPILVYWTRPPDNWVALNTDGAACNNHAAGGGIVRDRHGVHLAIFFTYYGNGTNNEAESMAILEGISLCKSLGYCNILILTDSNLCFKWFYKVFKIPWPLRVWWKKIWDFATSCQVTIEHTYREGNYAADHLASLGIKHRGDGAANCQVDNKFKQILVGDRLNIPNIRFRQ